MRIIATIEARATSTRLPGKVLMDIAGKPMLQHVIERTRRIPILDEVVVATTVNRTDDAIEALALSLGVSCFRGSEDDVLQRLADAVTSHRADVLVKVTGDMPLIDPELVAAQIQFFTAGQYDYVSEVGMKNTAAWDEAQTFPLGFGAEIVNPAALVHAADTSTDPKVREHACRFIIDRPAQFRLGGFHAQGKYAGARRPDLRLAVNTDEDLATVRRIFDALLPRDPAFGILDVVTLLERSPELA